MSIFSSRRGKIENGGVFMDNKDEKNYEKKDKKQYKLNKAKMAEFFKRNGFYIALFICIAAAGLTAILSLTSADPNAPEQSASITDGQPVEYVKDPSLSEEIARSTQTPPPAVSPTASPSPTATASPQPSATKKTGGNNKSSLKLQAPVKGKIIKPFSIDKLSYNKTLNQWATHNGVDIQAAEGDEVAAALAGTVETAYNDQIYGGVVIIKNSDNKKTVYAGVLPDESIKESTKVTAGQKLGVIKTPNFEAYLGPHLHFELLDGTDYLDPSEYF